jgi:hypothetical protein
MEAVRNVRARSIPDNRSKVCGFKQPTVMAFTVKEMKCQIKLKVLEDV